MKNLLLLLLFITNSFSQTNFKFDYILEYKHFNYVDSTKSQKIIYFTNSNDNSYFAKISERDSLNFNLLFIKQDKLYSKVIISKNNLLKGVTINLDCKNINSYTNNFKFQVENYDYIKENEADSIESYKTICSRSEKYIKKNKIGYHILKFNKNLPFHLPNFEFATLFEEWKKERDLPNNFVIENSFYDFENKLIYTEELIEYSKIDKEINIITSECGEYYLDKILKLKNNDN